jgi:hypothetical protein
MDQVRWQETDGDLSHRKSIPYVVAYVRWFSGLTVDGAPKRPGTCKETRVVCSQKFGVTLERASRSRTNPSSSDDLILELGGVFVVYFMA